MSFEQVREVVNERIEEYCKERMNQAAYLGSGYHTLWRFTTALLSVGGKRFRPYMLSLAYMAYAPDSSLKPILPAALAQELVHLAMLIHDDIIDRDLTRYGMRNVMGQYEDFYAFFLSDTLEKTHMSRSSAMLAGDVLLSDAYRLVGHVEVPPQSMRKALEIMSQAVFEVIGGELLDTEAAFINDPLITSKKIALHKTASYSFMSPLTMGAVLAGAPASEVQKISQFAEQLGVAYQLKDDLLGVFGDEAKTGKSVGSDISEGKRTYLVELFEQMASSSQKQTFAKIFHSSSISEEDMTAIRTLFIESGAKTAVDAEIQSVEDEVYAQIETLHISDSYKEAFRALVARCLTRE
jgi:geranylgeranyl diphosphate synthase type II